MATFSGVDLSCRRGERLVFTRVSFRVESGGALVVVGRNGAGKSSLLRLMTGLLPPFGGALRWDDADVGRDPDAHRARLRWVGHAEAVKPALTAAENLEPWAVLWGGGTDAAGRCRAALDALGIARLADVHGRYLSAGQKRRVALARLLVAPAPLWLLDEPRTGLDADATERLDGLVAGHRESGGIVVLTLHAGDRPPGAGLLDLDALDGADDEPEEWAC